MTQVICNSCERPITSNLQICFVDKNPKSAGATVAEIVATNPADPDFAICCKCLISAIKEMRES